MTTATSEPWTVQRILEWSLGYLGERGSESPRLDAELLLSRALKCSRIQLYTGYDKPLTVDERDSFRGFLKRRGAGEPVAYIIGEKDFMSLTFAVSSAVLIPRPDTEVLVETALKWAAGKDAAGLRVLDVGTGSGCIAVALAARLKGASVEAWDVDEAALAVAAVNVGKHVPGAVTLAQVDALRPEVWVAGEGEAFDLIVSNPPYIAPDERGSLKTSVVGYEPERALFAPADGLAFYRTFAAHARQLLKPGGALMLEIGAAQGPAVSQLLIEAGWSNVRVIKDYARLDRVVAADA